MAQGDPGSIGEQIAGAKQAQKSHDEELRSWRKSGVDRWSDPEVHAPTPATVAAAKAVPRSLWREFGWRGTGPDGVERYTMSRGGESRFALKEAKCISAQGYTEDGFHTTGPTIFKDGSYALCREEEAVGLAVEAIASKRNFIR
jgi:hypothetical protein